MTPVPSGLFERYLVHLKAENLSVDKSFEYQNWLRYFLDFCEKYQVAGPPSACLHQFIAKLRDKGRTEEKRQQAAHAIALYFEMVTLRADGSLPAGD